MNVIGCLLSLVLIGIRKVVCKAHACRVAAKQYKVYQCYSVIERTAPAIDLTHPTAPRSVCSLLHYLAV